MPEVFTLDKFAGHPFYLEVNRRLVALAGLRPGQRVIDLGAGTGAVTRLLAAEVASLPEAVAAEARGFFERNVAWLARVLARSHRDFSHDPEKRRRQALAILAALQGAMLVARSLEGVATFDDIVGELGR